MMQKRICPGCGKAWYSADCMRPWVCDICGAIIPVPEEDAGEPSAEVEDDDGNS